MKNKIKKIIILFIIILIITIIILGIKLNQKNKQAILTSENLYNQSLYEVIYYMDNVKNYLAKASISNNAVQGADTLTNVWREANLAQTYLSMLPISTEELESTQKFLNQVSDYSYSLSRKNINGEDLSEEDLDNLQKLHQYSIELNNSVNQIANDLNYGNLTWKDISHDENMDFAQQVSSNLDIGSTFEQNMHNYSGLIYDGAYSEHLISKEKKGLVGDDISEQEAKEKILEFVDEENIKEISSLGLSQDAEIPAYTFNVKTNNEENIAISISKKGGFIIYMNYNRNVGDESINIEQASEIALNFLNEKGFIDMKQTYYLKNEGVLTINFAYSQNNVIMYPDLIKVKIALDNGQVLGIETTGYLNNHTKRDISNIKITKEQAKSKLNKKLNIQSELLAMIPTEWKSEILCYEFKGKVDDTDYLVYINADTGEEQEILIITNTPNGQLAM